MITKPHSTPSFFSSLSDMLNQSHPLYKLADKIDWAKFDTAFAPLYCQNNGRPAKPIRLMCSLLILKHLRNLSDESVVEQWSENAYYQYFCGMQEFIPNAPCASSELVHFRNRIGEKGVELIFQESIWVNNEDDDGHHHDTIIRSATGIILGAQSFRNEYDGHTIEASLAQVERLTQRKIKIRAGDRGCRGKKEVNGTQILIPDVPKPSDNRYQKRKKHKLFCKRAGIEPTIGHLKSDHRLGRNFYRRLAGDAVNILLAAAAYNFKRAMRVLLNLLKRISEMLNERASMNDFSLSNAFLSDDYVVCFTKA